jgi:hypothetical protein
MKREATQEKIVYQTKDRGVHANAERQCEHGEKSKSR